MRTLRFHRRRGRMVRPLFVCWSMEDAYLYRQDAAGRWEPIARVNRKALDILAALCTLCRLSRHLSDEEVMERMSAVLWPLSSDAS
jgi:hypothetical protein